MRSEHVIPLQGKMAARVEKLTVVAVRDQEPESA